MKHATMETLAGFEGLLNQLRAVPGLIEKRPGVFYRKSKAFLHFHEDPSGTHADVKLTADGYGFTRVRAESAQEQDALVALAAQALQAGRR